MQMQEVGPESESWAFFLLASNFRGRATNGYTSAWSNMFRSKDYWRIQPRSTSM